jgi:hypothetical protein
MLPLFASLHVYLPQRKLAVFLPFLTKYAFSLAGSPPASLFLCHILYFILFFLALSLSLCADQLVRSWNFVYIRLFRWHTRAKRNTQKAGTDHMGKMIMIRIGKDRGSERSFCIGKPLETSTHRPPPPPHTFCDCLVLSCLVLSCLVLPCLKFCLVFVTDSLVDLLCFC